MADHTPSPPQDTFSTIAEGYGGAQQTLARLGFLPGAMPGSFSPSDRNGTAVQFPTPAPPRFPTVVSTTLPFPSAVPQFAGAVSPQPPSVLPPMFSTPQPTFTQGMPSANYAPQAPSYAPAMAPQAAPYPFGVPTAAPNWTRAFTQPMQGFGHPGAAFGGGSLFSDAVQAGYIPRPMFMEGPGIGVNTMQQRAGAGLRMNQRFEDWGASAISGASVGIGALGGAAALGIGGATLGGIASAAGLIAAPMMAASAWTGAYQDERAGTRAVQNVFSGMSMGPMMSPLGQGINPIAARQIQNKFKESTHGGDFTTGDMFSTMSMAQESGLMRGHTNSVDQVVTRVKELAKVTKSIMDLGQGITQQDAIELQAIASNMGIGTSQFAGQGIGKKLVTAARVTGQTVQDVMSGVGASGASLFAQAGMNAGSGMMVGVHTAGVSAGMVNSGMFSPRELSALGGESGIQNTMAQGIARFQAQNAGNMMRGMLTGPDALHAMQTGTLSMADASKQGGAIFKDQNLTKQQRKLAAQFFDEAAPDMLSEMQEQMTPERMQAMQIAQAASLMRNSKGTMTANTAFTKVTGSEEGAKVLMKLMEHPEILRAQSEQSGLIRREEDNRRAASYDHSQGWMSKAGKAVSGLVSSVKQNVGVYDAGDWAARRDYEQEARAAGVDPSSYVHKYKNLNNKKSLLDSVSGGKDLYESLVAEERAAGGGSPRVEFDDSDASFAVDALHAAGMRDSGASIFGKYTMDRGTLAALQEAQGSGGIVDEYKRYSEDPSAALAFMDDLSRPDGAQGDIKAIVASLATELASDVRKDPEKFGKILGTKAVTDKFNSRLSAAGKTLTDTQKASFGAELIQATGAAMSLIAGSSEEAQNAYGKVSVGASNLNAAHSGVVGADKAVERLAKKVTSAESGVLKDYADVRGGWYRSDSDDRDTEKALTETADLLSGAGLKDQDSIGVLLSTGGSREELLKLMSSSTATKEERDAARKIMHLDRGKNSALFSMAEDQKKTLDKLPTVGGGRQGVSAKNAAKELAGMLSTGIATQETGAAALATQDLMVGAGLTAPGSGESGSDVVARLRAIVRDSGAVGSEELGQAMFGARGLEGGSYDLIKDQLREIDQAKSRGADRKTLDALTDKVISKKLVAEETKRQREGDTAVASGGSGSPSSGDAGTEVQTQLLQEMSAMNKKMFDSLSELTGKSQKTVDSMTTFIAAVSARLSALEKN